MKRPSWWPPSLWPGGGERERPADVSTVAPPAAREAGEPPESGEGWTSFLGMVREALPCGRATLWRLRSGGAEWRVVAEVAGSGWGGAEPRVVEAPGHPFTWALKEELELQVPAEGLGRAAGPDGWALVAPLRQFGLCASFWFSSPPRSSAREALGAVRRHMAWCAWHESRRGAETSEGRPPSAPELPEERGERPGDAGEPFGGERV